MKGISGSLQVINGFITYHNLKPLIDPLVDYDDEEWVLFTKPENVRFIHSKCLLIGTHKSFELLTLNSLLSELKSHFQLKELPEIPQWENPYYFCIKCKNGYHPVDEEQEEIPEKMQVPSYFFSRKEITNSPKAFIIAYFYDFFKRNGTKYLAYYNELLVRYVL